MNWTARWDAVHKENKDAINRLLASPHDDDQEFIALARWLLTSTWLVEVIGPWANEPHKDWLRNAQDACSFLQSLHHAMVDDGSVYFCCLQYEENTCGLAIVFTEDEESIEYQVVPVFSSLMDSLIKGRESLLRTQAVRNRSKQVPITAKPLTYDSFTLRVYRSASEFLPVAKEYVRQIFPGYSGEFK